MHPTPHTQAPAVPASSQPAAMAAAAKTRTEIEQVRAARTKSPCLSRLTDPLCSLTSSPQEHCERACLQHLQALGQFSARERAALQESGVFNEEGEICLLRERHAAYVAKGLKYLGPGFICLDARCGRASGWGRSTGRGTRVCLLYGRTQSPPLNQIVYGRTQPALALLLDAPLPRLAPGRAAQGRERGAAAGRRRCVHCAGAGILTCLNTH